MTAPPAAADPAVAASSIIEIVTPHGMSTVARPSRNGAKADCDRVLLRTTRVQDAGGANTMLLNPGTPAAPSPKTIMIAAAMSRA